MRKFINIFTLLVLITGAAFLSGCGHAERQAELDEKPWNAPKSWEHGVPGSIMRGR